jgi:hypothetical protein
VQQCSCQITNGRHKADKCLLWLIDTPGCKLEPGVPCRRQVGKNPPDW